MKPKILAVPEWFFGDADNRKKWLVESAYHESGHALCFAVLDIPFHAVSLNNGVRDMLLPVESGPKILARVIGVTGISFSSEESRKFEEDRQTGNLNPQQIIGLIAGPIAEAFLTREADKEAAGFEHELSPSVIEDKLLAESKEQARILLRKNWAAVERIAGELLKKKRLSYSEVKELMNAITKEKT